MSDRTINLYDAKTPLSALVEVGTPADQSQKPRAPGLLKGRIHIQDGFDAPLPDDMTDTFGTKD